MDLDDDLDKFLDGLAMNGSSNSSAQRDPHTTPTQSNDDDDFLSFLKSSHDASSPVPDIIYNSGLPSVADNDPEDFLDWLNDDRDQSSSASAVVRPMEGATVDDSQRIPRIDSALPLMESYQPDLAAHNVCTDAFIDEVFGDPEGSRSVHGEFELRDSRSYADHLKAIIKSNFPDIQQLRQLVDDYGYIPTAFRAHVWSLLLTESCSEDDEVIHFDPSVAELDKKQAIISDCDAVISAAGLSLDVVQSNALKKDMQSVLMLFCLRRQADYSGLLCRVLSCLLAVPDHQRPSAGLSSACFYSVASEFLPFVNLTAPAQTLGLELIHTWLRTLLCYHSPKLVLHLDRVTPGWERPSMEISPSSAVSLASAQRGSAALDDLERELGMGGMLEGKSWIPQRVDRPGSPTVGINSSDGVIQSAPPNSSGVSFGCVPTQWITGVFSGSLPPREAALVMDWAILNNEKYAGFYLAVSLLTIYSDALLRLSGGNIRRWFEGIDTNKEEWFKSLALGRDDFIADSWTDFVRGWLSATAALIRSTPSGFKQTLLQTEEWACMMADRQQLDVSSKHSFSTHTGSMHSGEANNSEHRQSMAKQEQIYDNEDECDEQTFVSRASAVGSKINFMEKFRKLSLSFGNDSTTPHLRSSNSQSDHRPGASTIFKQYRNDKCDAVCVWASPEEVLPCICSNRRRKNVSPGIWESFYAQAIAQTTHRWRKDGDAVLSERGTCFLVPRSAGDAAGEDAPFYFGIDCRSPSEMSLGKFPKAYAFDPSDLIDADAITRLLETIQTLASSVHICLIGVGEKYIRWIFEKSNTEKKLSRSKLNDDNNSVFELDRQLEEYRGKLDAVAVFFLKQSFLHVSVLEGGFMAAVEALQRPESPLNLQSALVEVDRSALDAVLEVKHGATSDRRGSIVTSLGGLFTYVNARNSSSAHSLSDTPYPPVVTSTAVNDPSNEFGVSNSEARVTSSSKLLGTWTKSWSTIGTTSIESANKLPAADTNSAPTGSTASEGSTSRTTPGSSQILSSWGIKWSSLSSISSTKTADMNCTQSAGANTEQLDASTDGLESVVRSEPVTIADTTTISITKTEKEKEQALALHKMAGLRKGDSVIINRQELPGAILFPSIKYKEVSVDALGEERSITKAKQQLQLHRYLVISRERFLVLDSSGGGVGSRAVVKSNRHLSELMKMSFRKKDPELVQLFYANKEATPRQYRVSKREEFIQALQKHMERFK